MPAGLGLAGQDRTLAFHAVLTYLNTYYEEEGNIKVFSRCSISVLLSLSFVLYAFTS